MEALPALISNALWPRFPAASRGRVFRFDVKVSHLDNACLSPLHEVALVGGRVEIPLGGALYSRDERRAGVHPGRSLGAAYTGAQLAFTSCEWDSLHVGVAPKAASDARVSPTALQPLAFYCNA